jgi:hypothetical protein
VTISNVADALPVAIEKTSTTTLGTTVAPGGRPVNTAFATEGPGAIEAFSVMRGVASPGASVDDGGDAVIAADAGVAVRRHARIARNAWSALPGSRESCIVPSCRSH